MNKVVQVLDAVCDGCGKEAGLRCEGENELSEKLCALGWAAVGRRHYCGDCKLPGATRKNGRVYPLLRMMDVGETVMVPLRRWSSARSAASTLKKDFGSVYVVNRRGENVIVTRKS